MSSVCLSVCSRVGFQLDDFSAKNVPLSSFSILYLLIFWHTKQFWFIRIGRGFRLWPFAKMLFWPPKSPFGGFDTAIKKKTLEFSQVRTLSISYLQFIQLCYTLLGTFTEEYDLLSEYFTQKINLFAFWSLHLTENHAFLSQLVKIGLWQDAPCSTVLYFESIQTLPEKQV